MQLRIHEKKKNPEIKNRRWWSGTTHIVAGEETRTDFLEQCKNLILNSFVAGKETRAGGLCGILLLPWQEAGKFNNLGRVVWWWNTFIDCNILFLLQLSECFCFGSVKLNEWVFDSFICLFIGEEEEEDSRSKSKNQEKLKILSSVCLFSWLKDLANLDMEFHYDHWIVL